MSNGRKNRKARLTGPTTKSKLEGGKSRAKQVTMSQNNTVSETVTEGHTGKKISFDNKEKSFLRFLRNTKKSKISLLEAICDITVFGCSLKQKVAVDVVKFLCV